MDALVLDLSSGWRRLWKTPGFTMLAVLPLALAIGANTTVFSMLNALTLRLLPVEQPDRLVFLSGQKSQNQNYPNYLDFRDRSKTLSGLVASRIAVVASSHSGKKARAWGYEATGNYFQVLGIRPAVGRFFTPAEDTKAGGDLGYNGSPGCGQVRYCNSLRRQPQDPCMYSIAMLLMAAVACLVPAKRALAVDPASALREE